MPPIDRDLPLLLYVINDLAVGGAQRVLASQAANLDRTRLRVEVASLELVPEGAFINEIEAAGIPVLTFRSDLDPADMDDEIRRWDLLVPASSEAAVRARFGRRRAALANDGRPRPIAAAQS
jgi:hypothetical protein